MRLAVIPARGGSKRIHRKNVKDFCGKPIIAWSIGAAIDSGCFDRVLVSTDDVGIAGIAESYGAEVPFLRPMELADDHTGTSAVVAHAVRWQHQHGPPPDVVCCIYPTAPFLQPEDIKRGLESLVESGSDYAFSVTSYASPVQRAFRITCGNRIEMLFPEHFETRSQDLPETWHDAAQFYWGRASAWLNGKPIFSSGGVPVVLPRHRVQDIDTRDDWEQAVWIFRAMVEQRRAAPPAVK